MATNYSSIASNVEGGIHRSGMVNAATNSAVGSRELFLKLYAGEVLTSFQSKNIMMPLHRVRTISKGKSAQFPMTGKYRDASYHTPGNEITPTASKQAERVVSVDDLLINAQFIPNIDEAMRHYDIRSVYTEEAGFGLSKVADENILRLAVKASLCETKTIAEVSGMIQGDLDILDDEDFTPNVVCGSAAADIRKPKDIVQAIMDARRIFDNYNVPGDPFVVMPTDMYYDLFKVSDATNMVDFAIFNRDVGGGGSIAGGQVPQILGMPIYVTNHLGYYSSGNTWVSNLWYQATSNSALTAGKPSTHKEVSANTAAPAPLTKSVGSGRESQYGVPAGQHTFASGASQHISNVALEARALVMTKDAVATVKLMDMSVESEYQINRQGTLIVSKYAMGHNVLRPACAVSIHAVT
tara:strand:- start:54 stop:1286 length:1233 start_codon:yes stop_codon:yes gene_type:complete